MYKLTPISIQIKKLLSYFNWCYECNFSVWSRCPSKSWKTVASKVYECSYCRPHLFPMIYWTVLFVSLIALIISLVDLVETMTCPLMMPHIEQQRHFHIFGRCTLRKTSLLGCSVSVGVWLMFIFGILTVSPHWMTPWIWLTTFEMAIKSVFYILELIYTFPRIYLQDILYVVMPAINLVMVRCMREVFVMAINDRTENLLYII